MESTKLTIRLPRDLLEQSKHYARDHDTSLTRLINEYLYYVTTQDDSLGDAPIVQRLMGSLSKEVTTDDYRRYLEGKYGSQDQGAD